MEKIDLRVNSKIGVIKLGSYFAIGILLTCLPSVDFNFLEQGTLSSKTIFFGYALIFISLLLLLSTIQQQRIEAVFNLLDIAILLLLFFIILNRYYFHSFTYSIHFLDLIGLTFFYFCLVAIRERGIFKWLGVAIVLSGIMQAVVGNLQLYKVIKSNHPQFITGSYFNSGSY